MVKPESFQAFGKTVNRYGRGISNDYMLPGTAEKLIRHGLLYYEALENALLVFEKRDGYMKLTFRVGDAEFKMEDAASRSAPPFNDTAPFLKLAAFTVSKGSPGKDDRWLAANGFTLKQERVRYTAAKLNVEPLGSPAQEDLQQGNPSLCHKSKAEPSSEILEVVDASVAYPIYRQCFDMIIADLPCPELFEGALCVRDEKTGEAAGVLSLGADRHIGVLSKYRGQGIAMRLYAMLAAREPQLGTQRLFADVDNPASNGLYRKLGFKTDGIILRCYTK